MVVMKIHIKKKMAGWIPWISLNPRPQLISEFLNLLFEIFENKVDDNGIENMTDEELIFLKNQLLEELKNENIEDT